MELSIFWIKENFAKFNKKIFNDKLETPHFKIFKSSKVNGRCSWKRNILSGECDFEISISNYYDRTQKEFENTLIHEMIHLEFVQKGEFREHHGRKWQKRAYEIGQEFGYDIKRCNQATSFERMANDQVQMTTANYVVRYKSKDGRTLMARISPKYLPRFVNYLNSYAENVEWFITTNKIFSNYRKSVKLLNSYYVTEENWENLLLPHLSKVNINVELNLLNN